MITVLICLCGFEKKISDKKSIEAMPAHSN